MFTGLVRAIGTVDLRQPYEKGIRFGVETPDLAPELEEGDSVAVDGVCQTVVLAEQRRIEFEAIRTTLSRTTLADWQIGRRVNLEPPMQGADRFGGHLVQGHVDAVAEVVSVERAGETVFARIRLPADVAAVTVLYGSLAVDGVSMTVNQLDDDVAELAIIPYTWTHTAFSRLQPGGRVNVEADLIGKYVRKLLQPYFASRGSPGSNEPAGSAEPPKPTGQATDS